jgi:hypothetical protein
LGEASNNINAALRALFFISFYSPKQALLKLKIKNAPFGALMLFGGE